MWWLKNNNISSSFSLEGPLGSASVNRLVRGCDHTFTCTVALSDMALRRSGLRVMSLSQKWYVGQANAGVWKKQRETSCLHESYFSCVLLKYISNLSRPFYPPFHVCTAESGEKKQWTKPRLGVWVESSTWGSWVIIIQGKNLRGLFSQITKKTIYSHFTSSGV